MTRKNAGRLVSISIVFCVAALGAALYFWRQASLYQRYLEYTNDRAFSNLVTSVSNLDSALQKGVYADSPSMLSTLSAQIWRESTNAKSSLAQMTLNDINLDKTQKFISQAGEYAYTILRKSSAGAPLSKEERKTLTVLSDTADRLSTSLQEVKSKYNDGTIKLS
ncbi:MAG: germination protein YpeB, partial [Bacillota bacterium]|nr:germination protein YpeB [Bacillota bacterium]